MKISLSIIVSFVFVLDCLSQHKICGKISDEYEYPLKEVEIHLRGCSDCSTYSDINGLYNLSVPDSNCKLVFSLIGTKTLEIDVNNWNRIDLTLKQEYLLVDEVIIIGYRTVKYVSLGEHRFVSLEEILELQNPYRKIIDMLKAQCFTPTPQIMAMQIAPPKRVIATRIHKIKTHKKCEPQIFVNGKKYYGTINDIPDHIIKHIEIIEKPDIPIAPISRTYRIVIIRIKLNHRNDIKLINPDLFKKRISSQINEPFK